MRIYPSTENEIDYAFNQLKADQWQLDLLNYNPSYVHWGCFEDYMSNQNGWSAKAIINNWSDFTMNWSLDDYNEVVNFYFEVYRKGHECSYCNGQNLNSLTKAIHDSWYEDKLCENLTEIEVEALAKHGRLSQLMGGIIWYDDHEKCWKKNIAGSEINIDPPIIPTPEEVNAWSKREFGHDAINRWIAVEARAKHLGVYGECNMCNGGTIYENDYADVALQLWVLHPRKGASRGVYIESINKDELPEVLAFLKEAALRNQKRFSKIMKDG